MTRPTDEPASASRRVLRAAPGDEGVRLDAFLARALGVPRAEARRLLERGSVRLEGGARASKGMPVRAGAQVVVSGFTPPEARAPEPEPALPLRVLAEGPGWLAVDKPAGMAVHPLRPEERGTVLNAVAARHPEIVGVGEGGLRSGVVHRLDVGTSGVLLLATEEMAWQRLRRGFREHRAHKRYLALVAGRPAGERRVVLDLIVARHRPARVRAARGDEARSGRARTTELAWRVLEPAGAHTLLEVAPRTGFLHQIRATLAHLGHPVVGDTDYGGPPAPGGAGRPLLHAAALELDEVHAESPLPPDFEAALARARAPARTE